jgi:hypothetical protein
VSARTAARIHFSGAVRTEDGVERQRLYLRARERARTRVAALHRDEFTAVAMTLRAPHRTDSREYKAGEMAAKRAIAARHPEDFARLLDQELVAERMARR